MEARSIQTKLCELHVLITMLPESVPFGTQDGPLALYTSLSPDPEEGAWFSIDKAWIRTFQGLTKEEQLAKITRGEHGALAVYNCYQHFSQLPGIDLILLEDQIQKFSVLVAER